MEEEMYLLVLLQNTYYQYCRVPSSTYRDWIASSSKGQYYSAYIRGRYDCREGGIPES
ncbi:KTSC domain-containing protein [Thalassotalea sp. PS06]|nr:KTSC domain-containing protein [Thalassotalea sp. PS06]